MDIVYVMLLILAGISYYLQVDWLFLASLFMFFALVFSKYYSESHGTPHAPMQIEQDPGISQGVTPPQPIIVVSGGGGNTATVSDQMIATMMGNFMALDAFEKMDTANFYEPMQRGRRMRQGFFDHSGTYGSKHKAMDRQYSKNFEGKFDEMNKRLKKLGGKLDSDTD